MGQSFIDVLTQKIEQRQRLEARPMGTLTPKLHPAEVMELQLLARPIALGPRSTHRTYKAPNSTHDRGRAPWSEGTKDPGPWGPTPTRDSSEEPAPTSPKKATPGSNEQAAPCAVQTERPTPKTPMGVREVLAREVFNKWGEKLADDPLPQEISKSYRKLAFKLHPDRSSDQGAAKNFADLTAAYQILKSWAAKAY